MDDYEDDLADFLALLPGVHPSIRTLAPDLRVAADAVSISDRKGAPAADDDGDDPCDFLAAFLRAEVPRPPPITDRDAAVTAICTAFPDANPKHVSTYVARASQEWLERVLSFNLPQRVRAVLGLFFKEYQFTNETWTRTTGQADFAVRSAKEWGFRYDDRPVKNERGRSVKLFEMMPEQFNPHVNGRRSISGLVQGELSTRYNHRCGHCHDTTSKLSPDHRLPHHLFGDRDYEIRGIDALQPLCMKCNNEKNSACRACPNFALDREASADVCRACRWASPEKFTHTATVSKQPE